MVVVRRGSYKRRAAGLAKALATLRRERDEARRRIASLSQVIGLVGGELALEPLLTRIVEIAIDLIGAQAGSIGLVKEQGGSPVVHTVAGVGLPARERGMVYPLGVGLSGAVLQARAPLLVERYGDLDRPVVQEVADYTAMGIPIWWAQRIVGVFCVGAPLPHRFGEQDVETLTLFARDAAIAIENARLFGGLQDALATAQLLYQTSQRMAVAMTVQEVIAAYLEQVAAGGRYQCSVRLDEFDAQGRRSGTIVHGRWIAGEGMVLGEQRLPYVLSELDAELDAGQVVTVRDYRTDPRLSKAARRLQASVGRHAFAIIPLIVRGRRIGRVNLSASEVHDWEVAELQPYQVTAALLAAAIDSRLQYLQVAERGQQLAVLEERRRLARELHDSVTQTLFSMNLLAQAVPPLWETDQAAAREHLGQIRELTRGALAEMRALLVELRPVDERQPDLGHALRHHAATFERRTGIAVTLDAPAAVSLPDPVAYALSRIAQEALTNVARHAQARRVSLALAGGPPTRLVVEDDGRGFAADEVGTTCLGLVSMRERAAGIGARLDVRSAPGEGTRLVLEWPVGGDGRGGEDGSDPHLDRGRPPYRAPGAGDGAAPAAGPGGGGRGARRAGGAGRRRRGGAGPGADGPDDAGDGRSGGDRGDQGAVAAPADPGADDVRGGGDGAGGGAGRGGRVRAEGRGRGGAGAGGAAGA